MTNAFKRSDYSFVYDEEAVVLILTAILQLTGFPRSGRAIEADVQGALKIFSPTIPLVILIPVRQYIISEMKYTKPNAVLLRVATSQNTFPLICIPSSF